MSRTALIAGCTGLVGAACLELLLNRPEWERVIALARRPLDVAHPKLTTAEVNLAQPDSYTQHLGGVDDLFCALGTTIKRAGSQSAFRAVDYDMVVNLAGAASQAGVRRIIVVSALGAGARSKIFYNRVKGEMEAAVSEMRFEAVHILQPSLLLGEREEHRPGEALGQVAAPLLSPLLCGPLKKYRPIRGQEVAQAMVDSALSDDRGVQRHQLPITHS